MSDSHFELTSGMKTMAVNFTEEELRGWCLKNGVDRMDVINARSRLQVLGHRGPGRLILGCTGRSEPGVVFEAAMAGFGSGLATYCSSGTRW